MTTPTPRQLKKAFALLERTPGSRDQLVQAMQLRDRETFRALRAPNGCVELVAFYDAVVDADDTLEAVDRAIVDGDLEQARALLELGRESLVERINELRELL